MRHSSFLLAALAATTSAIPTTPNSTTSAFSLPRTCGGMIYAQIRNNPAQPFPWSLTVDSSAPSSVEIGFTVPSDAVGPCSLMLSLPAAAQVQGGAQVDVTALDGPAAGALVGTTQFVSGESTTINSFACRPQMCYSLGISGGNQGIVEFLEGAGSGVGVVMTYDC